MRRDAKPAGATGVGEVAGRRPRDSRPGIPTTRLASPCSSSGPRRSAWLSGVRQKRCMKCASKVTVTLCREMMKSVTDWGGDRQCSTMT